RRWRPREPAPSTLAVELHSLLFSVTDRLLQQHLELMQGFLSQRIAGLDFQRFPKALARLAVDFPRHVDAPQVVPRIMISLVPRAGNRLLQPGDGLIVIASLDQVGADIVVWVPV